MTYFITIHVLMTVKRSKVMRISNEPCPLQIMIAQKQLQTVEYFNYLGRMINEARCAHKIKSKIATAKEAFNRKKTLFVSKLDLNLRKKLVK